MTQPPADPIVYLNGAFVPKSRASLAIEDRGALFGDGAYEVVRYYHGKALEIDAHARRLQRSLDGLEIPLPRGAQELARVSDQLIARAGLADATCYWHVSRGVAPRAHPLPDPPPTPTVMMIPYPASPLAEDPPVPTVAAITAEDERWARCWIKSLNLLPNCLAKTRARQAGCVEAILHRDAVVTEGAASTAMIVAEGTLIARPEDQWVLPGVTRAAVVELARQLGIPVDQRRFTLDQLREAREVMLLSTTMNIAAVTALDHQPVADGAPGPVTTRLHRAFIDRIAQQCAAA